MIRVRNDRTRLAHNGLKRFYTRGSPKYIEMAVTEIVHVYGYYACVWTKVKENASLWEIDLIFILVQGYRGLQNSINTHRVSQGTRLNKGELIIISAGRVVSLVVVLEKGCLATVFQISVCKD